MKYSHLPSLTVFLLFFLIGSLLTANDAQRLLAEDIKCLKCHRGKDSLEKYVREKNIRTAEELRNLVRRGPKANLHVTNTDEDIERAIRYLRLP